MPEVDLSPLKVLHTIRGMYPDESTRFFTISGRRVPEPVLYPWRRGHRAQINGEWHLFDREGRFVSSGEANAVMGRR